MRTVLKFGVALLALTWAGSAAAQMAVTKDVFLDIGRCEGFYRAMYVMSTSEPEKDKYRGFFRQIRSIHDTYKKEEWEEEYLAAVESGRSAMGSAAGLAGDKKADYVERRESECGRIRASLAQ